MTEPIIPVKAGGETDAWWEQVVSLARADGVVNLVAAITSSGMGTRTTASRARASGRDR
jgi:hypothetical protein